MSRLIENVRLPKSLVVVVVILWASVVLMVVFPKMFPWSKQGTVVVYYTFPQIHTMCNHATSSSIKDLPKLL